LKTYKPPPRRMFARLAVRVTFVSVTVCVVRQESLVVLVS
jgi:hypothetical protein